MSPSSHDTPSPLEPLHLPKLDAEAGPSRRMSPQAREALVSSTLTAHAARKRHRRSYVFQVAAALTLLFGLSAAVSAAYLLRWRRSTATPPASVAVATPKVVQESNGESAGPAEAPPFAQEHVVAHETKRTAAPPSASDLLAHANQLRGHARWVEAAHAYERAVRAAPHSQAAYAAMVAAGGLYVEKLRKPARGATFFQRALLAPPTGALAEEARWGLAQAYKGLGNKTAERKALTAFLRHHPQAALAVQAQTRLQQLGQ